MCCSVEEGVHDCSGPQCHSQRSTVAQHLHRFCTVKVIISLFNFSVHTTIRRRTLNFRRLFGQSHLCVYVDGTQRLTVNMRLPPVNEVFSSLSICAPPVKSRTDLHGKAEFFPSSLPRKKNASDVRSSAVGLVQHVPNYFSLPISLTSLKSATGDQHSGKYLKFIDLKPTPSVNHVSCIDPGVRSVPLGTQDSIWGKPICLHGQIGTFALFQEALTLQHVRIFHDAGIDFML